MDANAGSRIKFEAVKYLDPKKSQDQLCYIAKASRDQYVAAEAIGKVDDAGLIKQIKKSTNSGAVRYAAKLRLRELRKL